MKKHVKAYMDANGYKPGDWIPCNDCSGTAVDVHHIISRGMGGSTRLDNPSNLVALCRRCHDKRHGGADMGPY